jgi:predicted Na+-dependent transporter
MDKPIDQRIVESWHARKSHATIFAFVSVLVPFIGLAAAYGVHIVLPPDTDAGHMGLRDFYYVMSILMLSFLIGALSGLIALVRRERMRKMVVAGLLLNCIPLFLVFVFHR